MAIHQVENATIHFNKLKIHIFTQLTKLFNLFYQYPNETINQKSQNGFPQIMSHHLNIQLFFDNFITLYLLPSILREVSFFSLFLIQQHLQRILLSGGTLQPHIQYQLNLFYFLNEENITILLRNHFCLQQIQGRIRQLYVDDSYHIQLMYIPFNPAKIEPYLTVLIKLLKLQYFKTSIHSSAYQ